MLVTFIITTIIGKEQADEKLYAKEKSVKLIAELDAKIAEARRRLRRHHLSLSLYLSIYLSLYVSLSVCAYIYIL